MLEVGEKAPEFTLPDHAGKDRSLSELLDQVGLILYFYPADFTPGCTREACQIRDLHERLLRARMKVVGVSPQDPATHARFRERYQLPFTLLSDMNKEVIRMFRLEGPLGWGVRRGTYLIDANRRIRGAVLADLRVGRHIRFVEDALILREPPAR